MKKTIQSSIPPIDGDSYQGTQQETKTLTKNAASDGVMTGTESTKKASTLKTIAAFATLGALGTVAQAQSTDTTSVSNDKTIHPTEQSASDSTKHKFKVSPGYNAVEAGVTSKGNLRTRALTNMDFSFHGVEIGYHGLNEFTKDLKGYFGRHVVTAGRKDLDLKLAGVVKTTADGMLSSKYGLRYNIRGKVGEKLGMYGFVDIIADGKSGTATFFLGKSFGKGPSVELFENIDVGFNGSIDFYTEIQLTQQITKGLNIFARGEMVGAEYKDAVYVWGITAPIK